MPQRIAPPSNAGPAGAAVETMRVAVAEHDLAVGADVDEQPDPLVAVHAGGQHARRRCRRRRTHRGRGRRRPGRRGCSVEPEVGGEQRRQRRGWTSRTARRRAARGRCRAPARSSWRCRPARPRRPRAGSTPPSAQHLAGQLGQRLPAPGRAAGRAAAGSIIVALIRVITSPPKGCCLLSIEADRGRRAGRGVEQRRHDGGGAEVEGDREPARRWCRRARRR